MIRSLFGRDKGYSCSQVLEVMQSFIDGEVSEATALAVSEHLDRCERCPQEVAIFRKIQTSLAAQTNDIDPRIIERLSAYATTLSESADSGPGSDESESSNS